MGTKNQSEEKKEQARTYWRAGRSQRWIAEELNVSPSSINNWVKGIEQDLNELVNTKTSVLEKESQLSVQEKFAVQEIVDERTKDLIFIRKASLIVAQKAVQKVQQEDCSMQDLRHAQEVIGKGKRTSTASSLTRRYR